MRKSRLAASTLILTLAAAGLATLLAPAEAEARRGRHRAVRVVRVSPAYYGFGWAPYLHWGHPHFAYHGPHRAYDRVNPAIARALEIGALNLAVKPAKTEVWLDGRYVGTAGDFDGMPSYLWIDAGEHEITLYRGGFETVERKVSIEAGVVGKLKIKLQEGVATRPGEAAGTAG